jgi:hypothetical protein
MEPAFSGTIRQLEQADFDRAKSQLLIAKRQAELKDMSGR